MIRTPTQRLRVAKKLLPGQPGTLKLGRRFGDALLCVRCRLDAQARRRYTTVELIVDHGPMAPRPDRLVGVRIRFDEAELRNQVKQHGAVWGRNAGVWRMPYRTASSLRLKARIVET